MGGAVEITGNKVGDNRDNNLYLGRETTVQTDSLTGKETIGVTTYNSPTDDSSVTITSDATSAGCFFSDNSAYEIGTDAGAGVVLNAKKNYLLYRILSQTDLHMMEQYILVLN